MSTYSTQQRKSQQGFSLTEMLVMIFLVGLIIAISVPLTLYTLRANRLNGAARTVLSDIRIELSGLANQGGYRIAEVPNTGSFDWPRVGQTVGGKTIPPGRYYLMIRDRDTDRLVTGGVLTLQSK